MGGVPTSMRPGKVSQSWGEPRGGEAPLLGGEPRAGLRARRPLSILYLGAHDGTALDRANALRRLGHQVRHLDLRDLLPRTPWVYRVTWHLGGDLLAPWIMRRLPPALADAQFDVCHVDCGEWVTPRVIDLLRR